jgi:hypothetical protein
MKKKIAFPFNWKLKGVKRLCEVKVIFPLRDGFVLQNNDIKKRESEKKG